MTNTLARSARLRTSCLVFGSLAAFACSGALAGCGGSTDEQSSADAGDTGVTTTNDGSPGGGGTDGGTSQPDAAAADGSASDAGPTSDSSVAPSDGGGPPSDAGSSGDAGTSSDAGSASDGGPTGDGAPPASSSAPWSKLFPPSSVATDVALDSADGPIIVGGFTGTTDFGMGPVTGGTGDGKSSAAFIARYDAEGKLRWIKTFNSDLGTGFSDVAVDSTGAIVNEGVLHGTLDVGSGPMRGSGSYFPTFFLMKSNADGSLAWTQMLGSEDQAESIAIGPGDRIGFVGAFNGPLNLPGCPTIDSGVKRIGFGAVLDPAGRCVWARAFPDTYGTNLAAFDAAGHLWIAGTQPNGGVYDPATPGWDAWIAELDDRGNILSERRMGDGATQMIVDLQIRDGRIVVLGTFGGTIDLGGGHVLTATTANDAFVARIDPVTKAATFATSFHATGEFHAVRLGLGPAREIVVNGSFEGELRVPGLAPLVNRGASGVDADGNVGFLVAFDEAGAATWERAFGGGVTSESTAPFTFRMTDVAAGSLGRMFITGNLKGPVDFGSGVQHPEGWPAFLARIDR